MTCKHCGNEIEADSKFCRLCGNPCVEKTIKKKRYRKTFRDGFRKGKMGLSYIACQYSLLL